LSATDPSASLLVRAADLADSRDADAVVALLDTYARDPRGGGAPLPDAVRGRLVAGLRSHPTTHIWLAIDGAEYVGVCVAFTGFSTFQGRPLLNIHDLAVLPGQRNRGTGRALLAAAEAHARATGCCKLTLEVQEDNAPARHLYEKFGFRDVVYGDSGPTRFLGKSLAG
jgi:ribosomal protein S18 acetylase RimI-like enzyme